MWDACLVLDGGCSFRFNDGAIATCEMFDEDALRTVELDWKYGEYFLSYFIIFKKYIKKISEGSCFTWIITLCFVL
jgi:hypothetical protein